MSLSIDGTWKAGVWATTVWADGVWREGAPAVVVTQTNTGGWGRGRTFSQYRDDEQIRQDRIARGIIPPDEPEIETVIEAAREGVPLLARRRLEARIEASRQAELQALLERVMEAQREARELAYQALIEQLAGERAELESFNRNQNASAVLVMLGLL